MGSPPPGSSSSTVEEFVRREVPDWDDEVVSTARFKAFSGQRSDWEPKFCFWRDLIVKIARQLGLCVVHASEVKNIWFCRGGVTPLCMDHVLHEMHTNGDILLKGDLVDPTSERIYQVLRRVAHIIGISRSPDFSGTFEGHVILKTLLQERCSDVIKTLTESHWTSTCIVTMRKFQSICKNSDEAYAVLSHFCDCGKARYFSIKNKDFIEGVKVSLDSASVSSISSLDYDILCLVWTTEKLQQQLDVIDKRWESSRKMALSSFKLGNKQAAYRYIRQAKLFSGSRSKCTSLLERVEEVLSVIAIAESTKKVSEAIQIGAKAMKEHRISVDEMHRFLQEFDENVALQKQVDQALEAAPLQYVDDEDENIEEEFKKLEVELAHEVHQPQILETVLSVSSQEARTQDSTDSTDSLNQTLWKLNLEAA